MNGNSAYAIPGGNVSTSARMRQFAGFIFWTAWSAAAERPGQTVSYTNNWPYEPLVGNRPTGDSVLWTGVSIIMLLAGICAMVWWYASQKAAEPEGPIPHTDPLGTWAATPSQRATQKYFFVISGLILAGYESMHMIRKGQVRWLAKGDVVGQIRFIHQIYGIAV
jgi:nitric oxide reductase subunit B